MESNQLVNIDFNKFRKTFRAYVRAKAVEAGSTIVYVLNGQLVEEDPRSEKIVVLKESFPSK